MFVNVRVVGAAIAVCGLCCMLVGCATTNVERAAKASNSVQALQADIQTANDKIGASLATLNDLVKNPKEDLRPQFDAFCKAMDDLDGQLVSLRGESEQMKARGQEYFKAWEESAATISNEDLKQHSSERRAALSTSYDNVKAETERVGELGKPLIAALRDMRTVLSMDLTPNGLKLAAPPAEKANAAAAELKAEVEKLVKELDGVAKMLSPAATAK